MKFATKEQKNINTLLIFVEKNLVCAISFLVALYFF